MSTLEAPKYNNSLGTFSIFIQTVWTLGLLFLVIGLILLFNTSSYDEVGVAWSISIIYIGSALISFGIIGMFLRQTAKIIVEGLGGSIRVDEGRRNQRPPYNP